jgi:hypothetical protein
MTRRLALVTAVLTVLALLASPAAGSVLGPRTAGRGRVARFQARGAQGYKVSVFAPLGQQSRVAIDVENVKGGAQYVATGTVTATRISASFGRFGRIDMRFKPSGKVLHSHLQGDASCPYPAQAQLGTFVGSFRFLGEGGYTKVDLHRVDGGVGDAEAPFTKKEELSLGSCHQEEALAEPLLPTTPSLPFGKGEELKPGGLYLYASAPTAAGHAFIAASPFFAKGLPLKYPATVVIGMVQEEVEAVRIGRIVFGGGRSANVLPDHGTLSSTILTPGAPFTGSATYLAGPSGTGTLAGDLSVPMPGAGTVPFAGPTFQAELLRPETAAGH